MITRTKEKVELWCNEEIFKATVLRKTVRASGLGNALKEKTGNTPT